MVLIATLIGLFSSCFAGTVKQHKVTHKAALHSAKKHGAKSAHASHSHRHKHLKKSKKHSHPKPPVQQVEDTVDAGDESDNQNSNNDTALDSSNEKQTLYPTSLVSSMGQRLVGYVHTIIESLQYSTYKLGGSHFDTSNGVYIVDCSSYVDHILQSVCPQAYTNLLNSTGSDLPTSQQYYSFFNTLPEGPTHYWNKISDVSDLRSGDILVFRYKTGHGGVTAGHVMVVMDKPTENADTYSIQITDSASSGHSEDTRQQHDSGIGIGTLLIKADAETGEPKAYAWKVGSRWRYNVKFAMARPMDFNLNKLLGS